MDDDPWTPDTVRDALDSGERTQRALLREIQRRVRGQVAPMMLRCSCLHRDGYLKREDLVQTVLELLIKADFERLRAWKGEPAYLWGYVWGFSRNVVRGACKKCNRSPPEPEMEPPDPGPELIPDMRKMIMAALDELEATVSKRTFTVFQRIDLQGRSHTEVAEEFKITPLNVSQYLHQARKRLKEIRER